MENIFENVSFFQLIWLFFIISAIIPAMKQARMEATRIRLIRQLEKSRNSRVITLVHRQESISLLGIPITKYINIEDSEQILRAIRLTPSDMPIDILLHTPGGLVLASEQIANALKNHPAKVTVFVPHYAMSGGTMIAMAADEIVMDGNAVLGPVDPQLGRYPAVSILKAVRSKDINEVDDETLIMADIAEKAINQVRARVYDILVDKLGEEKARDTAKILTEGQWTHDYPISCSELAGLGLPACGILPREIYELMDHFPQPTRSRPSVQYIPIPYNDKEK
ncbi:MAG: ATP-dependent Clp protease proteolytic subunit [Bacillota bacterium]|nr:ATP-dependent Clp protease proteolytic subunit [Bacillota bacterium]MDW7683906.1 ATP-dependent Clp protease proteolytic subunit [Bacillota bacterium]